MTRRLRWGALVAALTSLLGVFVSARPTLLTAVPFGNAIYDRHQRLLRLNLAEDGRYRLRTPLADVADSAVQATLFFEDRAFFWHWGLNPWALSKALAGHALGHSRRGASTLSMQVARLRFGIDSHTLPGKCLQIARALQLELYYSKHELLEAYFNLAPYGANIEGIGAASLVYFNKNANQLSLAESLALAVMPQRPTARAPQGGREVTQETQARHRLAQRWLRQHPQASAAEVGLNGPLAWHDRAALPFAAPHLSTRLAAQARRGPVITSLDFNLQTLIERLARAHVAREKAVGINNVAVMLVDWTRMEVLASLGSVDFADARIQGQVDGTQAKRSPGSALKPFIYALALQRGLIHPRSLLKDAPARFGAYSPENFDGEFLGPVSATQALVHSRNLPAVALTAALQENGDPNTGLYDLLRKAHVRALQPAEHYGLALALGGAELTMEELVTLYAMLANLGELRPLRFTLDAPPGSRTPLLRREAAALTLQMLRAPQPGSHRAQFAWVRDDVPIAWKTGTSYGFRDAWTLGVAGQYVLAVWAGNFDSSGNPALVGRRAAAPLFFSIMEALRPHLHAVAIPAPALHLAAVDVCAVSGQIAGPFCPHKLQTSFIPGVSPIGPCDVHREVRVDLQTGARACPGEVQNTRSAVYEFWPSDLTRLFALSGLPRTQPPPYGAHCSLTQRASAGLPPRISAPQTQLVYALRAARLGQETIALSAIADGDADTLHWFVGQTYVGASGSRVPLLWKAQPGEFVLRVVDNNGRSASQSLRVAVVD